MSEAKETELKTIAIGDKVYSADSITEQGVNIINDLQRVDQVLSRQQLDISITQLAKAKLIEELDKEKASFTEVEAPEAPEA
jgi:hypothetical protein